MQNFYLCVYNFLVHISPILSSCVSFCGILVYFKWKREVVLARKIYISEEVYFRFMELYEIIYNLYNPLFIMIHTDDIDIDDDNILKKRIHDYRHETLVKNRKKFFSFFAFAKARCEYIGIEETDFLLLFNKFYLNLLFITSKPVNDEEMSEEQKSLLSLDDELLSRYKEILKNEGSDNKKYTCSNGTIERLRAIKKNFDVFLKKLKGE